MRNYKTYAGLERLADERYRVAEMLGIEPNSKEFWRLYRVILGFLAEEPQTAIRGEKHGEWYVNKEDIDKFIEDQKQVMEKVMERRSLKNKNENYPIGIDEIKQLIQDLEEVGIEPEKTLKIIKKKLGMN